MLGVSDAAEWNAITTEIERRTENAKATCIRARGFDYTARSVESRVVLGPPLRSTDPAFIDTYGFGISTLPPQSGSVPHDPNKSAYDALSDDAKRRWNDAENACESEGSSAVGEELTMGRINSLLADVESRVRADKDFGEAQRAWKRCTEAAGIRFTGESWVDLVKTYTDEWQASGENAAGFGAREIAAAKAAATCATPMWKAQAAARRAALEQLDGQLAAGVYG